MSAQTISPVSVGVLLAGGSSRRAGVDKRYLVLDGRTLIQRNLAFLRGLFPRVVVSLAPGQTVDLGDAAGAEVVHDAWPGASPLAGIASALRRVGQPIFAMATDFTHPDQGAAEQVLAAFPGRDAAVPAIGRHHEPLFAAYGLSCLGPSVALLESGRHRIVDIFPQVDVADVPFADESRFPSVNTIAEFEATKRRCSESSDRATEHSGDVSVAPQRPALVAVVGKSDSGKTTFIERLLPELIKLGMVVGTVKHDAHSFEIDHPGKDSWRHGQAGARAYTISSSQQLAFITKLDREIPLIEIVQRYYTGFDIVVAEGYKRNAPHCIEIFRAGAGYPEPICASGEALALVTDTELDHEYRFALDDVEGVARFIAARLDTLRDY